MKLLVPILFSLFQSSSAQCLQCVSGLLGLNDCTQPSNQQQVNCWVNKGCMVGYNLLGTPVKMGCNDDNLYPINRASLTAINNRTTIFQGCGGGLPKNAVLLSYLYPPCFNSLNPDGTYVTQCTCNDADNCNVNSRFFGSCDLGWTYYNVTSKCYQVTPLIVNSYNEANNFCIKYGATLVSIQDLDENNFIANNVVNPYNNNTTPGFYIGLRWASGDDHTRIWGNGDTFNFTHWLPGQPDGKPAPANITRMIGTANGFGYWDDITDTPTFSKKAICQKPAYSY
uniref:C-type lectin domain-containing protein n=1 Tax=Acrobeloides nanus TaxID=290746 RepID=A0A914EBS9_9BILA